MSSRCVQKEEIIMNMTEKEKIGKFIEMQYREVRNLIQISKQTLKFKISITTTI